MPSSGCSSRTAGDEEVTWRRAGDQRDARPRGFQAALFSASPAVLLGAMPALTQDQGMPLAYRRFAYRQVALFDVCLGRRTDAASRIRHRQWTAAVEAGLAARADDAELLESIRRTVRRLLEASAVPPEEICAPATVVQPQLQVAIISAPPRTPLARMADRSH